MKFNINIIDETENIGIIQIGDFTERFEVCPCYWDHQKYKQKWIENLTRLTKGDIQSCCLMTWMHKPNTKDHFRGWVLFRSNQSVFIQEKIFVHPDYNPVFDEIENVVNIGSRKTITEDGDEISEWVSEIDSIDEYIKNTQPAH